MNDKLLFNILVLLIIITCVIGVIMIGYTESPVNTNFGSKIEQYCGVNHNTNGFCDDALCSCKVNKWFQTGENWLSSNCDDAIDISVYGNCDLKISGIVLVCVGPAIGLTVTLFKFRALRAFLLLIALSIIIVILLSPLIFTRNETQVNRIDAYSQYGYGSCSYNYTTYVWFNNTEHYVNKITIISNVSSEFEVSPGIQLKPYTEEVIPINQKVELYVQGFNLYNYDDYVWIRDRQIYNVTGIIYDGSYIKLSQYEDFSMYPSRIVNSSFCDGVEIRQIESSYFTKLSLVGGFIGIITTTLKVLSVLTPIYAINDLEDMTSRVKIAISSGG